jgi:hypothetical protein
MRSPPPFLPLLVPSSTVPVPRAVSCSRCGAAVRFTVPGAAGDVVRSERSLAAYRTLQKLCTCRTTEPDVSGFKLSYQPVRS